MPRRTTRPRRAARELAQQKSDFTAEGAPAPGKVGASVEPAAEVPSTLPTRPSTPPRHDH